MPLVELSDDAERTLENALLAVGLSTGLTGGVVIYLLPAAVVTTVSPRALVLGPTALGSPVAYLLVRRFRDTTAVPLETVLYAFTLVAFLLTCGIFVYLGLVLGGYGVPLP